MPRSFPFAFLVAVAWLSPSFAQEKPKSQQPAPQPRSQGRRARDRGARTRRRRYHRSQRERERKDGLARHDPRGHGRCCPTAGRSSRPAARRGWATCRSRSPCIPAEPILAILHAGYGEHEVVTVNATTGKIIGRVVAAGDVRRAGLVGRRQAALRRRRVRRPDLSLRPRRRAAVEQDRSISRPRIPGGANPRAGSQEASGAGRPGALAGRQDALRRRRVRPFARPVRRRVGCVSRRDRARGRQLSLRPGARRVAQAAVREPLEQGRGRRRRHRTPSRSSASWPTQEHPNEMLLATGGKILLRRQRQPQHGHA